MEPFESVAGGRADGADPAANAAQVPGALVEAFEETFDSIDGGEDEEVVRLQPQQCGVESCGVTRLDLNDRQFDDAGTEFGELGGERGGLLSGSGDDYLLAKEGKLNQLRRWRSCTTSPMMMVAGGFIPRSRTRAGSVARFRRGLPDRAGYPSGRPWRGCWGRGLLR